MTFPLLQKHGDLWFLKPEEIRPEKSIILDWDQLIPQKFGSEKQRTSLKSSAQCYLFSRFNVTSHHYSSVTVRTEFVQLKRIIRWMAERGILSFDKIQPHDLINMLHEEVHARGAEDLSMSTLKGYISFFQRLWELRGHYRRSLKIDPGTLEDEILSLLRTRSKRPFKAINDDAAYALIQESIKWLQGHGDFLARVLEAARTKNRKPKGAAERKAFRTRFYRDWARKPEFQSLRAALTKNKSIEDSFRLAIELTEGALLFLLLILVGFRISELAALNRNCHEIVRAIDGSTRSYISGIAAKKGGLARKWIADEPLPRVLQLAHRFSSASRSQNDSKALFTASPAGGPSFWKDSSVVRRMLKQTMASRIRLFVSSGIRRGGTKIAKFHPHMARKTFAQFAVRRDKKNLEAVAAQLGHVYKEFTDGAYIGSDFMLSQLLAEEDRKELERGLRHLLSTDRIAGGAAESIRALQAKTRAFGGKLSLKKLIETLIAKGVKLAPCNWGFCVYSRPLSACRGDDNGPNEVNRAPEVCAGCSNFATTPLHHAWWNERAMREEQFLKIKELPEQTKTIVLRRLSFTRRVLSEAVFKNKQGALRNEKKPSSTQHRGSGVGGRKALEN